MAKATGKASVVIFSPHIHSFNSIEKVMWDVVIALIPAGIASVYFFGTNALRIIIISVLTAVITELFMNLLTKSRITIMDGSAVITGLLFAYNLPPAVPWYLVVAGSSFAIAIVKWAFGGLGYNFMNPAIGGRIFVLAAWTTFMVGNWSPTIRGFLNSGLDFGNASLKIVSPDVISTASPLNSLKAGGWNMVHSFNFDNYWNLFIGNIPGCIGETSKLALLVGFVYLLIKKVVTPIIPLIYIATVALLAWIFGGLPLGSGIFTGNPLYHILSGGLILGACFMATDYVTSPIGLKGKIVFAVSLGVLTMIIRLWGGYPEGVSYAIAFMNIFVPLIDRYVKERIYGHGNKKLQKMAG